MRPASLKRISSSGSRQTVADRPAACQLDGDTPCTAAPELKVADSWGDSAWGCLDHVDEAILNALGRNQPFAPKVRVLAM